MASYDHGIDPVEDDGLGDFIVESDEDDRIVAEEHEQSEEEEEGEEEEEEEEEPPAGQMEILSYREQLKAEIRRKNQLVNGAAAGKSRCSSSVQAPANDRFGSFFGRSRPSLSRRVIEEGFSSIMRESQDEQSKTNASLGSKTLPNSNGHQRKPKPISEVKKKADTLRQNRDYSSLFSDDADVPPNANDQPDTTHSAGKSAVSTNKPVGSSRDYGLKGGTMSSIQRRAKSKADSPGKKPLPNREKAIADAKNRSSLPAIKKSPGLQSSNGQKPQPSLQSKRPQASPAGQGQHHSGQVVPAQLHDRSKLAQKQLNPSSKLTVACHHYLVVLPSRPISSRPVSGDKQIRKRLAKRGTDDEFDRGKISSMIRGIFNYNPEKYMGRDEDDRNMEADYRSIQMEERRSAKLARKEDEEQLRLIQEEERRERQMKRKKTAHDP